MGVNAITSMLEALKKVNKFYNEELVSKEEIEEEKESLKSLKHTLQKLK